MKHYDKLYIRTKNNVAFDTKSFPLAFATPYEDNAAGRKRQQTVDNWATGPRQYDFVNKCYKEITPGEGPFIVDNLPLEGFKIYDVNSRYRTNNKFFTVFDPRGFSLEIDTYNLLDILEKGTIEKGVIKGKMIWYRNGPSNYLQFFDENIAVESKKVTTGAEVGDLLEIAGMKMIFVGKAYMAKVMVDQKPGDQVERQRSSWSYSFNNRYEVLNWDYVTNTVKNEKPLYIMYDQKNKRYYVYRSMPKYSIEEKNVGGYTIADFITETELSDKWYFASSDYNWKGAKQFFFATQEGLNTFMENMKNNKFFAMNVSKSTIVRYRSQPVRNITINGKIYSEEEFNGLLSL